MKIYIYTFIYLLFFSFCLKGFSQNTTTISLGGSQEIIYNLDTGEATYINGNASIMNFYAEVKIPNSVTSRMYTNRTVQVLGAVTTIVNTGLGLPTMKQWFVLDNNNQCRFGLTLEHVTPIETNYMAPMVAQGANVLDLGVGGEIRTMSMPWFQPNGVRWEYPSINGDNRSYNVTTLHNVASRNGFVLGALTHDNWRSAVLTKGVNNLLTNLEVMCGAPMSSINSELEHGKLSGTVITSSTMMIGFFDNYKNGLEEYAKTIGSITPKLGRAASLTFDKNTIISWKTWGNGANKNSSDVWPTTELTSIPVFIKEELQPTGFQNTEGKVVIAVAGNTPGIHKPLKPFREQVDANDQIKGAYNGTWKCGSIDNLDQVVHAATSNYTLGELVLRDHDGNIVEFVNNAGKTVYAFDPTHPGNIARLEKNLNTHLVQGNQFIRLDFTFYGGFEGKFYNPEIKTGVQAYNFGMKNLIDKLEGKMHINLAISPYFPFQYGHSRRISGDTSYKFETIEYELNALAGGWWLGNGNLYDNLDPGDVDFNPNEDNEEATMSQINAAAITGYFQSSDDFTDPHRRDMALKYLTKTKVFNVLNKGVSFEPLDLASELTPNVFYYKEESTGILYIALFNHTSGSLPLSFDIDRIIDNTSNLRLDNLWTDEFHVLKGNDNWTFYLPPHASRLFKVYPTQLPEQNVPEPEDDLTIGGYGYIKVKKNGKFWTMDPKNGDRLSALSDAPDVIYSTFKWTENDAGKVLLKAKEYENDDSRKSNLKYYTSNSTRSLKAEAGNLTNAQFTFEDLGNFEFRLRPVDPITFGDNTSGIGYVRWDEANGDIDASGKTDTDNTVFIWVPEFSLGIQEDVLNNEIKIYPIPAYNKIYVDLNGLEAAEISLKIYSILGKLVGQKNLTSKGSTSKNEIDIGNLQAGMYIMKIENAGKVQFFKFLKQD
ncbi:T9SS type A sorting domain-containing protein [Algibacter amylolyticus]|uniref:T9SS type A sorting domain-containing protein n=1 Tax=Algibacter amylolyticus TaxID=1608400 RepID=A0A5M7B6C5_9FLAO|nr:T9SS type A sorting domain-containing protein [Algibacter amylolyticus]KAA5825126.1 T9SS type A sorting domain-containing protein [Algibacter amylolyticus]MBB5268766.1 hypothetical protein [Algibacter amylolyticus]TSJ77620.1 T9SS type A sorting domain-containing protein [Algibacter amylolyticus]